MSLHDAAKKMMSAEKSERDAGEATLLAARTDSVPALIGLLTATVPPGGTSPIARAALFLGALKARDALPGLCSVVDSGRASVVEAPFVARAIAEIVDGRDAFDDDVRGALEALAASADLYARAYAAEGFGALGDQRSRGRVQALATDPEPWVRDKARAVLLKLADAERVAAAADATATATEGVDLSSFSQLVAQAENEGGALKPWLDDLSDARRQVRDNAVAELVKAGKAAVPWLIEKLNQPSPRARIGAATALSRLQPPEACGPLLIAATMPAQTQEEQELRPVALRALANCLTGVEEGLSASILPLTRDPDRFVRAAALLCLGRLADRQGMKAVVVAILEDDPFVVESAAVALSEGVREEDGDLVRPLLTALGKRPEPKPAVKEAILIALSRIQIDAAAVRVRVRHRVRRDVFGATASTRKAAIVLLERLFDDADPPPLSVVDDVLSRLSDEHPEVRVVAASFLSKHLEPGLSGAAQRLATTRLRGERTVSLLCLEALRRHDTTTAKEALEAATKDGDSVVAGRAVELLDGFAPKTAAWVFEAKSKAAPTTTAPTAPTPNSSAATLPPSTTPELQRPKRVRGVTGLPGEAVDAVDAVTPKTPESPPRPTVEARFDDPAKPS